MNEAQKTVIMKKMAEQYHKLSPQTVETIEKEMERLFGKTESHTKIYDAELPMGIFEDYGNDKTTITLEYYANDPAYADMTSLILKDAIQKIMKQAKHITRYELMIDKPETGNDR